MGRLLQEPEQPMDQVERRWRRPERPRHSCEQFDSSCQKGIGDGIRCLLGPGIAVRVVSLEGAWNWPRSTAGAVRNDWLECSIPPDSDQMKAFWKFRHVRKIGEVVFFPHVRNFHVREPFTNVC